MKEIRLKVLGQQLTEMKKAEDKCKQAEQELKLSDEILKNASEGIYIIGLDDGLIKRTNPKFEEMFGYGPGEMIGKNVSIVNAPTDKTADATRNEILGTIRKTGGWHGEIKNIKKDSTVFWSYANVSLFDHPEYGQVIISIHTDITERKRAEEELNKKIKELETFHAVAVGRELKMEAMEKELDALKKKVA